jgi:hypothetical protein
MPVVPRVRLPGRRWATHDVERVNLRVLIFALSNPTTRRKLAYAAVCPGLEYAALWWLQGDRLDRHRPTADEWKRLEFELRQPFSPGRVAGNHVVTSMLLPGARRASWRIDYVGDESVEGTIQKETIACVDTLLRARRTEK